MTSYAEPTEEDLKRICTQWEWVKKLFRRVLPILAMILLVGCAARPQYYAKTTILVQKCDCGKICNKHFRCGLASCPHGFK